MLSLALIAVWMVCTSTSWSSVAAASEKDWVMISRCQATCLVEFGASLPEQTQEGCSQDDNCFMCWEVCEKLMLDTVSWAPVCQEAGYSQSICPAGCQTSCATMLSSNYHTLSPDFSLYSYPNPVDVIIEDESYVTLTWQTPVLKDGLQVALDAPIVYTAFWRDESNFKWQQFVSTTGHAAQIEGPHHLYVGLEFKVAAITADGIIAVDTPFYPAQEADYDYDIDYDSFFNNYDGRPDYINYAQHDSSSTLEEVQVTAAPAQAEDLQVQVELRQSEDGALLCSVKWESVAGSDYVISWKREECGAENACDQPHGPWSTVFESLSEKSSLVIDDVTYNSKYWVELQGVGSTSKVYFYTPHCDNPTARDSVCTQSATTPTHVTSETATNGWYQESFFVVTGVSVFLLLLVVAMAVILLCHQSSVRETIIRRSASLRASGRRRMSRGSLKTKRSDGAMTLADLPLLSTSVSSSPIISAQSPIYTAHTPVTPSHCQIPMDCKMPGAFFSDSASKPDECYVDIDESGMVV